MRMSVSVKMIAALAALAFVAVGCDGSLLSFPTPTAQGIFESSWFGDLIGRRTGGTPEFSETQGNLSLAVWWTLRVFYLIALIVLALIHYWANTQTETDWDDKTINAVIVVLVVISLAMRGISETISGYFFVHPVWAGALLVWVWWVAEAIIKGFKTQPGARGALLIFGWVVLALTLFV